MIYKKCSEEKNSKDREEETAKQGFMPQTDPRGRSGVLIVSQVSCLHGRTYSSTGQPLDVGFSQEGGVGSVSY